MSNQENYIKQLEQTIGRFLEPINGVPSSVAIRALIGCKVLAFNLALDQNKKLLR